MINANVEKLFSLLLSVKYVHSVPDTYDYSHEPRPCHNFLFMLDGEGSIKTQGKTILLKQGDVLFIPKNTTYISYWAKNSRTVFQSLHFCFSPGFDPLFNKNVPIQLIKTQRFNEVFELVKSIEKNQYAKGVNSFITLSSFYAICAELFKDIEVLPLSSSNKAILPALKHIELNYAKTLTIEELASLCYLSPSRFFYLFKQQTGLSPIAYKNRLAVLCVAQELLSNKDESIKNIAEKHGFLSLIYFERLFKKIMGKTPSQYKKENTLL